MKYDPYRNRQSRVQAVPKRGQVTNDSGPDTTNIPAPASLGSSSGPRARELLLQRAAKRTFDITLSTIGILLFSPLFLLSSLAVALDSRGPIVCRQVRHGYGNETFRIFQFRCTTSENSNRVVHAARKGVGVTRVGCILRSFGIDGLPQLFNVLHGEMSIVGPRPYTTLPGAIFEDRTLRLLRQHKMKPGLTGWAQVNGYGDVSNSFRALLRQMECDCYYLENWSFLLDMKIILMTLCSRKTYAITEQPGERRSN
jgi:lipopolysaccharide/colanic/teichoic acid biosynthesis glycosyltransferase